MFRELPAGAECLQEMDKEDQEKRGNEKFPVIPQTMAAFPHSSMAQIKTKMSSTEIEQRIRANEREIEDKKQLRDNRLPEVLEIYQLVPWGQKCKAISLDCEYSPGTISLSVRFERRPFNQSHADADADASQTSRLPQRRPMTPSSLFPNGISIPGG